MRLRFLSSLWRYSYYSIFCEQILKNLTSSLHYVSYSSYIKKLSYKLYGCLDDFSSFSETEASSRDGASLGLFLCSDFLCYFFLIGTF